MQATAEWLETDYYDVLGVASDADQKQIKSAYRKLARTAHPDANPDDPTAEERFSDIAKAYEVLSDKDRRAEYDELRTHAAAGYGGFGQSGFGGGGYRPAGSPYDNVHFDNVHYDSVHFDGADFDISDLFEAFGASRRSNDRYYRSDRHQADWPMRGADITARLSLEFADAINGHTTTLELDGRTIKTRIPAGVSPGQTIRLAGKGSPGVNGGPDGDLFIEISVEDHPVFERSGRDLKVTVPIPYTTAVLGGEASVPTLDGGAVTIKVPAGTPVGRTFRIPNKGVPHTAKPGALLASITIDVPTAVSDEDAELLRQLAG